jgi:hypothetical protein
MSSFVAGKIGDGAFWQSSILWPDSSSLMQSSAASPSVFGAEVEVDPSDDVEAVDDVDADELDCAWATPGPRTISPRPSTTAALAVRIRMCVLSFV